MLPNNDQIMSAATGQNVISSTQWAQKTVRASFQFVVTGTATGSLQLYWSDDYAKGSFPNQFVPTHWTALGSAVAVTAAGVYTIPLTEMSYEYLYVKYTDGSGGVDTGTIVGRMKSMGL